MDWIIFNNKEHEGKKGLIFHKPHQSPVCCRLHHHCCSRWFRLLSPAWHTKKIRRVQLKEHFLHHTNYTIPIITYSHSPWIYIAILHWLLWNPVNNLTAFISRAWTWTCGCITWRLLYKYSDLLMAASKIVRPCQNISVRCPQDILISAIMDRNVIILENQKTKTGDWILRYSHEGSVFDTHSAHLESVSLKKSEKI